MAHQKVKQLAAPSFFGGDRQPDVRPVEALHVGFGISGEKSSHNVGSGNLIRCCRQRSDWRLWKKFMQMREVSIFRAESRAPLGNAVCLVHHDQRQLLLL